MCSITGLSEIVNLDELNYTDRNYNTLYESTIASKNRMLKKSRKEEYAPPTIYRYTLKRGEDIWTIIAKTSLTVDTIATLNRIDFTGMLREESVVYLPDTLGLFFDSAKSAIDELAAIYAVPAEDISTINDPFQTGNDLLFVPEARLSFTERTYLTGVVFYAPLMGVETSKFGSRADPFINEEAFHGGIDIAAREGKKVYAARWGKIVYANESNGYGNLVILEHELGYHTFYGHLDEILVEFDGFVESGGIIGTVGQTGRTTGPHLHFEIRRFYSQLNPDNIPFFMDHQLHEN
jgi:murein DD-endopeptidase MepM/ murein hydrolase activator NlpD